MPEAYSTLCELFKMLRHIENPDIARKVYSGSIRYTQGYSAKFSIAMTCHLLKNIIIWEIFCEIF